MIKAFLGGGLPIPGAKKKRRRKKKKPLPKPKRARRKKARATEAEPVPQIAEPSPPTNTPSSSNVAPVEAQPTPSPPVPVVNPIQQRPPAPLRDGPTVSMKFAVALFSYDSSDPEDLKFAEGDIIVLTTEFEAGEWVRGFIFRSPSLGTGSLPSNYLNYDASTMTIQVPISILTQLGIPVPQVDAGAGAGADPDGVSGTGPSLYPSPMQPLSGSASSKGPSAPSAPSVTEPPSTDRKRLAQFLSTLNMTHYLPDFAKGEVMYDDLPMLLEDEELAAECVPKRAPRLRLLRAIRDLQSSAAPEYY